MKDLKDLDMHLKTSSLLVSFLFINALSAQNLILSENRQDILDYSKEKIKEDSNKLSKDWINSITYSYVQNDGDTINRSNKSLISINQPIFKSGGIYYAIKYASSLKDSNNILVNLEEKELIKNATNLLFNIQRNNLLIQKQNLILKSNLIEIKQKQESVLNGLLDISFLNTAILENNKQKENLLDLEFQNIKLSNNFNNLTAKRPHEFTLPLLKLVNKKDYLKNNIYIKQSKAATKTKNYLKGIVQSKYLPTVNANYAYTNNHTTNTESNNYGFSIVVPLNFGVFNDISSSKIDYLKSKTQEKITKRVEKNFLSTAYAKLNMIDKKIELTKDNIESFKILLSQMEELQKAGLKTKDDVVILANSKDAETLDTKIFSIDRQIELLELYSRVDNAI